MTIEEVIKTLRTYYSDTSRTKEDTLAELQELQDEIEILIDTLRGGFR